MSIPQSERTKSIIRLYQKTKNMAAVGREFHVTREAIRQMLMKYGIAIDKKGSQGRRKISTPA